MNTTTLPETKLIVSMLLKAWHSQVANVNNALEAVGNDKLLQPVSPGKNTGAYILGHLAGVHDGLFTLLNFGDRLYPELEKPFVRTPDSGKNYPPVVELKKYWNEVNDRLAAEFNTLEPEEWLSRHTAVSPADFVKEPHRNKLNVLISRTNHLSYHHGQLVLLKSKED